MHCHMHQSPCLFRDPKILSTQNGMVMMALQDVLRVPIMRIWCLFQPLLVLGKQPLRWFCDCGGYQDSHGARFCRGDLDKSRPMHVGRCLRRNRRVNDAGEVEAE